MTADEIHEFFQIWAAGGDDAEAAKQIVFTARQDPDPATRREAEDLCDAIRAMDWLSHGKGSLRDQDTATIHAVLKLETLVAAKR